MRIFVFMLKQLFTQLFYFHGHLIVLRQEVKTICIPITSNVGNVMQAMQCSVSKEP